MCEINQYLASATFFDNSHLILESQRILKTSGHFYMQPMTKLEILCIVHENVICGNNFSPSVSDCFDHQRA